MTKRETELREKYRLLSIDLRYAEESFDRTGWPEVAQHISRIEGRMAEIEMELEDEALYEQQGFEVAAETKRPATSKSGTQDTEGITPRVACRSSRMIGSAGANPPAFSPQTGTGVKSVSNSET